MKRQGQLAFACFSVLWAAAMLQSMLSDYPLVQSSWIENLKWVTFAFALWVCLRPTSTPRLLALTSTTALTVVAEMPAINNHALLILFVAVTYIGVYGVTAAQQRRFRPEAADLYVRLAPIARAEVLILYFWATVHKVNTGYFNLEVSCATTQLWSLHDRRVLGLGLDFIPTGTTAQLVSMIGTLAIETAIPLLLLVRRTRSGGVVLGVCFHTVLGMSYPVFSALMFALLSLFLFPEFWEGVRDRWERAVAPRINAVIEPRRRRRLANGAQLAFPILAGLTLVVNAFRGPWVFSIPVSLRPSLGFAYGAACTLLLVTGVMIARRRGASPPVAVVRPAYVLWMLPLLVFANGLGPHVGFKSTLSFSMFSNLRTAAGQTNHLFLPAGLQAWDHGRDLVRIHGSSDSILNNLAYPGWGGAPLNETFTSYVQTTPQLWEQQPPPRWRLPWIALRQRIALLARRGETGILVVYERDGQLHRVAHAERDPELSQVPYMLNKLLRLRAVPDNEDGLCMW